MRHIFICLFIASCFIFYNAVKVQPKEIKTIPHVQTIQEAESFKVQEKKQRTVFFIFVIYALGGGGLLAYLYVKNKKKISTDNA